MKGKQSEWYQDEYVGGYFDENGILVVCEEYGLTDEDTGRHFVQVQNGEGYYNENGFYHSYGQD